MHELGHNLGLDHGGADDINCKPNYLSVMSYSRQFSSPIGNRPLDYSRSSLVHLNESSLNEPDGVS
jgi:predicted Zn-dependent protease